MTTKEIREIIDWVEIIWGWVLLTLSLMVMLSIGGCYIYLGYQMLFVDDNFPVEFILLVILCFFMFPLLGIVSLMINAAESIGKKYTGE